MNYPYKSHIESDDWVLSLCGVYYLDLSSCLRSGDENFLYSFNVVDIDENTLAVIESRHRCHAEVYDDAEAQNNATLRLLIKDLSDRFIKNTVREELERIVTYANDRSIKAYHERKVKTR